jgi:hypothetical protein
MSSTKPLILDNTNSSTSACKVGINKSDEPNVTLDVNGDTNVNGTLDVNGIVNLNNTTTSISSTTGALIVDGGVGIAENLYVGGTLSVANFTLNNTTVNGTLDVSGIANLNNTTTSTTSTTGALIVDGGVGIAENLNVGGIINASVGENVTSTFGTASIGYNDGDSNNATFAHHNHMNGTDFALRQNNSGDTVINAKSGQLIYFRNGDSGDEVVINGGRLGIAINNPAVALDIVQSSNSNDQKNPGNAIRIREKNNNGKYWDIGMDVDTTDPELVFEYQTSGNGGQINAGNAITNMNFTGQHRCIMNINIDILQLGLIVLSHGEFVNINNSINPYINESLPLCELATVDNCKKVFGVISDKEDSEGKRTYLNGSFGSFSKKTNINEQRLFINSLGEGAIWVCNKNGPLENGDFITSSSVTGYGMKQTLNEEFLTRYTVAKITCDCDFNLTKIVKQKVKTTINSDDNQELVYDTNGDIQYENDLDTDGNVQMVYKYDTRFLDETGNEIEEGSHTYIACFVGCTYHCG